MKLVDDKKTWKPYDKEFKEHTIISKSKVDDTTYKFTASISGGEDDRCIYLTTGYPGYDSYTNNFILFYEDIMSLKQMIDNVAEEWYQDRKCIDAIKNCYEELYRYIDAGIVEYIIAEKISDKYPNYHDELYIPFKIKPKFINDLSSKDIDMTVNLGFNFIDCFSLVPTNYSITKFLQKITNNTSIELKFINYDIEKEIDTYKKNVLKDLEDFDIRSRKIPTDTEKEKMRKILDDMNKKLNTPV